MTIPESIKKTRYLLGPNEEPESPRCVMTLECAIETLRTYFDASEQLLLHGDRIVFELVEMTDAEVDALPEL